jgi:hypothetical protein
MSRYWDPDEELARSIAAEELARAQKRRWPQGAVAGLVLVAVSCLALGAVLYQVAGPRDVVEGDAPQR